MPDDGPKPVGKVVGLVTSTLALHDTAQPLKDERTGTVGLRCRCRLALWSTDDNAVLEMHRTHVALEIVRAMT